VVAASILDLPRGSGEGARVAAGRRDADGTRFASLAADGVGDPNNTLRPTCNADVE
jgi:hypothetical protein